MHTSFADQLSELDLSGFSIGPAPLPMTDFPSSEAASQTLEAVWSDLFAMMAGKAATDEAGFYSPAHLAGVPWPWRLEQSHTMLIGTTGTGKAVAIHVASGDFDISNLRCCQFSHSHPSWFRSHNCSHSVW